MQLITIEMLLIAINMLLINILMRLLIIKIVKSKKHKKYNVSNLIEIILIHVFRASSHQKRLPHHLIFFVALNFVKLGRKLLEHNRKQKLILNICSVVKHL